MFIISIKIFSTFELKAVEIITLTFYLILDIIDPSSVEEYADGK